MQRCDTLGLTLGCLYNWISEKNTWDLFAAIQKHKWNSLGKMALQGHWVAFRIKAET